MKQLPTGRTPVHPLVAVGFTALCAGLLAWAWLGTWQWATTGLIALTVCAVAAGTRKANT